MKRLLPVLLCLLALAVPRLYGQHTVTFVADPVDGGTVKATYAEGFKNVDITSGAKVPAGKYVTFKAEAKEGYEFEKFTVNGLDAPEDFTNPGQYATELSGDLNVVAIFKALAPAKKYAVTFTAEPAEYGTLTATRYDRDSEKDIPFNSGDEIEDGIWVTFNAKPGADYKVEKWLVNGTAIEMPSNPNEHGIELKEALDVKVVFTTKPNEVTLKYSVAEEPAEAGQIEVTVTPKDGGAANPVASDSKVARGSKVTFTAKPATGYEVEKWLVNGTKDKKAGQSTTLTITLDEDTEVQLFFQKEAKKCTINLTADPVEGGTIKATGYINDVLTTITNGKIVPEGSYLDFEATANEGYEFEKWTFNGTKKENLFGEPNKLSFVQIIDNTNVVAHFKKVASKITITYTAGEHGKFTKVKVQKDGEKDVIIESGAEVDRGAYIVFPVEPDKGYIVDKWFVNDEEVHSREVNSYDATFEESSEIKVTFRKPKLTIADAEGGKIVAKVGDKEVSNGADVALGENVSIEATPDAGYELTALTANDKDILAAKSFAMKGDTKVAATFTRKANVANYKVTLKSNEHGTISIKEKVDLNAVPEGTKLTVEAKGANDKCELTKLTANGVDILKDKTFTVAKDTEVIAEFVDHTGIDAVAADAFVIYPNPASESATITGLAPEAAVALYTLDGQLITRLAADRSGHLQIDLTALSEGTYLVVTEGAAQRLVVKH
ncbi:T9SS type A sorting domain-containing protein [Porphyromonas uenonis]